MANHKSALKRAKQNDIRRMRNKSIRTNVKNAIKAVRNSAEEKSDDVKAKLVAAQIVISKAAKRGVLHSNTASRKISRLTKFVNSLNG